MGAHLQPSKLPFAPARAYEIPGGVFRDFPRRGPGLATEARPAFDADALLTAAKESTVMRFRKSECVFAQGDPADAIFYVRSGNLKSIVVSNTGKEATIGVIGGGDYCGEGCLIDEAVRPSTAMAMTPAVVVRVPKKSFCKLLRDDFEFWSAFTQFLVARSLKVQQDLIDQRFHSSEHRLARLLLSLAENAGSPFEPGMLPRISQETLASMVGTTRSRISFFLNKFKRAGLIEYHRGIRVKPLLRQLVA
jgi:CRP-like cAMP-binding protein